jgi:hypothetical protein
MCTVEPLAFPRNKTDTQPPPATDEAESTGDAAIASAVLSTIVQPLMLTLNISKVAMAPPQVEQGSDGFAGQSAKLPLAMLPVKVLF